MMEFENMLGILTSMLFNDNMPYSHAFDKMEIEEIESLVYTYKIENGL